MSFILQHGYGKSDKLDYVSEHTTVSSVILSPTDETPEGLAQTATHLKSLGVQPLLDPQTYLYTDGVGLAGRCHSSNGLSFSPIRWSQSPGDVQKVLTAVEQANNSLGTNSLIAPSILQSSFEDIWTPLGIQYARAAAETWSEKEVYASIVFEEIAFAGWEQINDWLDEITTIDVHGFYLLANHRGTLSYPASGWAPNHLANAMRMIYTLTEINGYELIWGYSDIEGLLGLAVGATGVATGWHNSLRRFSIDKWRPKSGGAQPIPRRFVSTLLSPLRLDGELSVISSVGASHLIPKSRADALFQEYMSDAEYWKRGISQKHHMVSMGDLVSILTNLSIPDRLDTVESWIQQSLQLFEDLGRQNLIFEGSYTIKLQILSEAISAFRNSEGI
ncbi:hypothetical protein [Glutamicibacter mishrai]|nr:hypothetical protein [Glutamicibacter mishrai]